MKYHNHTHIKESRKGSNKYIVETRDHEFVDSEVVKLLSKVYAFCEEEGHAIMDCPFVPFHIKAGIT